MRRTDRYVSVESGTACMHAISLGNTVFEGGNTVYVFGEGGGGPVTLVDTGFDYAGVRAELESGLRDVGVDVTDVDRVLLTHHHADHAGLAGWVQGESDATVAAHVDDVALVSPDEAMAAEVRQSRADHMAAWGCRRTAPRRRSRRSRRRWSSGRRRCRSRRSARAT